MTYVPKNQLHQEIAQFFLLRNHWVYSNKESLISEIQTGIDLLNKKYSRCKPCNPTFFNEKVGYNARSIYIHGLQSLSVSILICYQANNENHN